ncbi:MAG TPA: hypothetical protein VIW47_04405 [Nitrospiraceae bacterium]|jgi:hypothetical protein
MMPLDDISGLRFQIQFLAVVLFLSLQSLGTSVVSSAAEPETQRRHSLIYRSAVEFATLPATTQGTILQPHGAKPPRITTPNEPLKPSTPLPTMSTSHHRTLTKHPALATITAPTASSQIVPGIPTSGIATGQVTQTTADIAKGTIPPVQPPPMKSAAATHSGITSTGAALLAPTASSAFARATSGHSVASAGNNSTPSSHGSRSALNLIKNPSIASLLQAPTPVVTTPPALPPSATPPSTPPSAPSPPSPPTGSLTLTWAANREPDLAGYKIYVGTASGTYNFPGSAFVIGTVTSYTISNLPNGQTYFFAMSAYDSAGNESVLSAEVSKSLF